MDLVGMLVAAVPLGIAGGLASRRRRAGRRNAAGLCAHCASAMDPAAESFYVEGQLVCPSCAARTRRAVRVSFALLALVTLLAGTAVAFGVGTDLLVRGAHYSFSDWMRVLGVTIGTVVALPTIFWIVIRGMKAENRDARARRADRW